MNRSAFLLVVSLLWACSPTEKLGALDVGTSGPDRGAFIDAALDGTPPNEGRDAGSPAPEDGGLTGDMGRSDGGAPIEDTGGASADGAAPPPDQGPQSPACPPDWAAGTLEADDQGGWSASGNTNDSPNRTEGACGGGSGQHIYAFTAPEAGQYAVEVVGEGIGPLGFAVVFVRTHCADPATELACEARREPRAISIVPLDAEQTVYLFVDGIRELEFPSTGGYRLHVFRQEPPLLEAAAAWMNDENGSTLVEVSGLAGNVDLSGVQYRFLDAADEVIPSRLQVEPLQFGLQFITMEREDGRTAFSGALSFNAEIEAARRPEVTQMEVGIYDVLGAVSPLVLVPVADPEQLEIGDLCDLVGARDQCPEGTECFIRDPVFDEGPACHPSGEGCPGTWTVTDLDMFEQDNGTWRFPGNLRRDNPPLQEHGVGSCPGATGQNDLFRFTAPAAGTYRFETSGMLGDTILWVRSECGVDGPAAELGCNDDGPGLGRFSRVDARLDGGQSVYVFVDAFDVGNRNEYTLTVSRL